MDSYVELDSSGFLPEEFADVKRCLETLCSIRTGSQPLDRDIGINYESAVGYPLDVAKNMLSLEIIEKVKTYEPRAEVASVEFDISTDGKLIPKIHFVRRNSR